MKFKIDNKVTYEDGVWYGTNTAYPNVIFTNTPLPSMKTHCLINLAGNDTTSDDIAFGYKMFIKGGLPIDICCVNNKHPLFGYSNISNCVFTDDISHLKNSIHIKIEDIRQLYEILYKQLKVDSRIKCNYQLSDPEKQVSLLDQHKAIKINCNEFIARKEFKRMYLCARIQDYILGNGYYHFLGMGFKLSEGDED